MLKTTVCLTFFFFNDTATTEIYPLSLHDALPISIVATPMVMIVAVRIPAKITARARGRRTRHRICASVMPIDRKSTRLNSSHLVISYAVFCLKKKNQRHVKQTPKHRSLSRNCEPD